MYVDYADYIIGVYSYLKIRSEGRRGSDEKTKIKSVYAAIGEHNILQQTRTTKICYTKKKKKGKKILLLPHRVFSPKSCARSVSAANGVPFTIIARGDFVGRFGRCAYVIFFFYFPPNAFIPPLGYTRVSFTRAVLTQCSRELFFKPINSFSPFRWCTQ